MLSVLYAVISTSITFLSKALYTPTTVLSEIDTAARKSPQTLNFGSGAIKNCDQVILSLRSLRVAQSHVTPPEYIDVTKGHL